MKSLQEGTWTTLLKDWLSSTHLQLRTKRYLQKTSRLVVTTETSTTIEPYFAANIETWPAKNETIL